MDQASVVPALFTAFPDLQTYLTSSAWQGRADRLAVEAGIARVYGSGIYVAHCIPCGGLRRMEFTPVAHPAIPNWREELKCEQCGMISRMRFALGWVKDALRNTPRPRIYITEQVTPGYGWLRKHFRNVVGSEYLAEKQTAVDRALASLRTAVGSGLHHQDVTQLSFADACKDAILSFEVLEHVPNYRAALREFYRVLAPGGMLLLTVPFQEAGEDSLVRARLAADGTIEYLLEPEYHGDPLKDAGCLAYYAFGWNFLKELRATGFSNVGLLDGWCPSVGHLGFVGAVVATRP